MVPSAFAAIPVIVQVATGYDGTSGCEKRVSGCFIPNPVTIPVGGTVTWKNNDTAPHTATSGSPIGGPSGVFDSSLIMDGSAFSHKFEDAGTFDYFCMVHPWMAGTVLVSAGASSDNSRTETPTKLILDPLLTPFKATGSDSLAAVTFSGKLVTYDRKFFIYDAPITLKFTGFTFEGKDHYKITTSKSNE